MRILILALICLFSFSAHGADAEPMQAPPKTDAERQAVTISTGHGTSLEGIVAGPEDATLGVLLLHDRWGIDDTIKQWVSRFAERGYRALAIDVFDGRISSDMALATEILNATDPETVKANVQAGLDYLKQDGRKLVTLGAGFGGWQSFQAAIAAPGDVAATVVIYGLLEADVDQVRALKAPLLTLYARDDERISGDMIEEYRLLIKKSLITHRSYVYPAAQGFMDPQHPNFNGQVTDDVWLQVDDFLAGFVEG